MTHTLTPPVAEPAKLLDVKAVADMCGCSTRHVYRLSDAGKMPAPLKVGSLVRWPKRIIEDWIDGGCKPIRSTRKTGRGGQ